MGEHKGATLNATSYVTERTARMAQRRLPCLAHKREPATNGIAVECGLVDVIVRAVPFAKLVAPPTLTHSFLRISPAAIYCTWVLRNGLLVCCDKLRFKSPT